MGIGVREGTTWRWRGRYYRSAIRTPKPSAASCHGSRPMHPGASAPQRSTGALQVGREKELTNVKRLLEDNRLLTLTGSSGRVKTNLRIIRSEELAKDSARARKD
jgi:hypothetical protein